ncbi:hypothetical protein P691DRAFT_780887 [Macrolepiota fuliginosa MF-IS2]|uniref:Uncharacterized protein n=1 Tax=Macrolepiota fuliginosa MF-IS2 TaxID=1400762 RepID=A0A9P6BWX3_9AGAR|nr:hypothetical protein P691DRAFT_780887 [Macrolepiota fuliginosa MF-IS2]
MHVQRYITCRETTRDSPRLRCVRGMECGTMHGTGVGRVWVIECVGERQVLTVRPQGEVPSSGVQQTLQAIGQGLGLTGGSAFASSFKSKRYQESQEIKRSSFKASRPTGPATPGGRWSSKVDGHDAVTRTPTEVMAELVLLESAEGIKTGILWIEAVRPPAMISSRRDSSPATWGNGRQQTLHQWLRKCLIGICQPVIDDLLITSTSNARNELENRIDTSPFVEEEYLTYPPSFDYKSNWCGLISSPLPPLSPLDRCRFGSEALMNVGNDRTPTYSAKPFLPVAQ